MFEQNYLNLRRRRNREFTNRHYNCQPTHFNLSADNLSKDSQLELSEEKDGHTTAKNAEATL